MEKIYISPEFEVFKVDLIEDALVGDGSLEHLSSQTDEPELPTGESTMEDF